MTYTDLVSTPDTTNNREPNFPGFPNTGSQVSDRYITRGTLRSTLGSWSTSSPSAAPAVRPSSRRRSRPASSAAPRSPIRRVPPQHQRCRRHHQRGVDRLLLGARSVDQGRREHPQLDEGIAQHPGRRLLDAHRCLAPEPAVRADDELRRRYQRPGERDLHDRATSPARRARSSTTPGTCSRC